VKETGRPIAQVARELGINAGTLNNWVIMDREAGKAKDSHLSESEREQLQRLRKENAEIAMSVMTPLCLSSRCRAVCRFEGCGDERKQLACDVAFEASDCVLCGLSLCGAAVSVVAGALVTAEAGQDDGIERCWLAGRRRG
jgi:Transposase